MDDLETFGGRLKVEISVKCGSISEVALTTMLELDSLDTQGKQKIRDTIIALRSTMPVAEIKAEDQAYNKPEREPVVGLDGKLTLNNKGLIAARAGQADLAKALEGLDANIHGTVPKPGK